MKKVFTIFTSNVSSTFKILPRELKIQSLIVMLIMIMTILLETISFTFFIPLFDQLFNKGMNTPEFFQPIVSLFSSYVGEDMITNLLIIILLVYTLKSILLIIFSKYSIKFIAKLENFIDNKVYYKFLNQSYQNFKKYESSKLNKELILDIGRYKNFTESALTLMTEIFVMVGLGAVLFLVDTITTLLVLSTFVVFIFVYLLITKKVFANLGYYTQKFEKKLIQTIYDTFNLFKEVRIFNIETKFHERFKHDLNNKVKMDMKNKFFNYLPKIFLELLIISILILTFIVLRNFERSLEEIIIILGLASVASIRIMPSITKSVSAINQIKYCEASVNIINSRISEEKNINQKKESEHKKFINFSKKIEFQNLSYQFKNSDLKLFKNFNLLVNVGQHVGIVGASGSGKSTLLDIIMFLNYDFEGKYFFDEFDVKKNELYKSQSLKQNFGYVSQEVTLLNDTIKNNIVLGSPDQKSNLQKLNKCIQLSQLESFIKEQPNGLDTFVGEKGVNISGGQRQRIGVARALYNEPRILILDEITSSLDVDTQEKLMKEIVQLKGKTTIIQTTHNSSHVKYFDKVINLNEQINQNEK